jgi:hypothetical protein
LGKKLGLAIGDTVGSINVDKLYVAVYEDNGKAVDIADKMPDPMIRIYYFTPSGSLGNESLIKLKTVNLFDLLDKNKYGFNGVQDLICDQAGFLYQSTKWKKDYDYTLKHAVTDTMYFTCTLIQVAGFHIEFLFQIKQNT